MVHTWKLGLVSTLFLLQECFLTASGPTVYYLAVAVHGYFSYLPQAEVEVLGGGAPTLLRASEFLFVEKRLV